MTLEQQCSASPLSTSVSSFSLEDYSHEFGVRDIGYSNGTKSDNHHNNYHHDMKLKSVHNTEELFRVFDQQADEISIENNTNNLNQDNNNISHPNEIVAYQTPSNKIAREIAPDPISRFHEDECNHKFVIRKHGHFPLLVGRGVCRLCGNKKNQQDLVPSLKCKYCKSVCHEDCFQRYQEDLSKSCKAGNSFPIAAIVPPCERNEIVATGIRTSDLTETLTMSQNSKSPISLKRLLSFRRGRKVRPESSSRKTSISIYDDQGDNQSNNGSFSGAEKDVLDLEQEPSQEDEIIIKVEKPAVILTQKIYTKEDGSCGVYPETLHLSLHPVDNLLEHCQEQHLSIHEEDEILKSGKVLDISNIRSVIEKGVKADNYNDFYLDNKNYNDVYADDEYYWSAEDSNSSQYLSCGKIPEAKSIAPPPPPPRNPNRKILKRYMTETSMKPSYHFDNVPARRHSFHGPFLEHHTRKHNKLLSLDPLSSFTPFDENQVQGNSLLGISEGVLAIMERTLQFYDMMDINSSTINRADCYNAIKDLFKDIYSLLTKNVTGASSWPQNITDSGLEIISKCQNWMIKVSKCSDYSHCKLDRNEEEEKETADYTDSFLAIPLKAYKPVEENVPIMKNILLTLILAIKVQLK